MQVDLYNMAGEVVGKTDLSDEVFGATPNTGLLHQAVLRQLANARLGTADTKKRGEISGGGRKPWKEKGTGRARQGSTRSPHFRGGGVVFGPQPHSFHQAMPKKMRRLALRHALSSAVADGRVKVLDTLAFAEPKTREGAKLLQNLTIDASALLVTPEADQVVVRSIPNIPDTRILPSDLVSVLDVMKYRYVILPVEAVRRIEQRLGSDAGVGQEA